MARLEELTPGGLVKDVLPDAITELVSAKRHGSDVIEVVHTDFVGRVGNELLFRGEEPSKPEDFCGSVELNPLRVIKEAGKSADELNQQLSMLPGSRVSVNLEVHAETASGAPDSVVRTITENARTPNSLPTPLRRSSPIPHLSTKAEIS